ncbi:MAG: polysaccharide biosynthesis C-terminal domain-containing protein [Candidatus Muirbacterium halophilum]|nr:polysaccharide biosynthesis C-terminal domain-containing protein [Candidatus Muirbacterium halophilum]
MKFLDNPVVGIYSLALIPSSISYAMMVGMLEVLKNKIFKRKIDKSMLKNILLIIVLSYFFITFIILYFKDFWIKFLSDDKYNIYITIDLIFVLMMMSFFHTIVIFFSLILQRKYETKIIGLSYLTGIISNFVLNYFFVIRFGLIGVSFASLMSIIIVLIGMLIFGNSRKIN